MRIDRQVAKEITDKIKDFINTLEAQYGVVVEKSSGSFSDAQLKLILTMKVNETKRDEGVLTPAEAHYETMRNACNLPPRGTVLIDAYGERWMPTEWIIKGRKYNVLAVKVSDGKRYKFTDRALAVMRRDETL